MIMHKTVPEQQIKPICIDVRITLQEVITRGGIISEFERIGVWVIFVHEIVHFGEYSPRSGSRNLGMI